MEPYRAERVSLDYKIDKELLILLSEANQKYGEYKGILDTLEFDSKYFLDLVLLNESYNSTRIEGTRISQDKMYYLKYLDRNDEILEIENLKSAIEYGYKSIYEEKGISINLVNQMHKILLNTIKGTAKSPGQIRTVQNWIGVQGTSIKEAIFVPPAPDDIVNMLSNLYEYMNDAFIDPLLINIAISHAQFETIHPYKDGNGRLGRALIPVQMAYLDNTKPILYLSEVIELYKPSYQRNLMESRRDNLVGFIKFFLQCVIEQCTVYISKLNRMKEIYKEDMEKIRVFRDNSSVYEIMYTIMQLVVFTKKEVQDETSLSLNIVSNTVDKLIDIGVVIKDNSVIGNGYRYENLYNLFK